MFKPLLRTIPTLTGNFTLACKLDKYKKNSVINYECGVTEAVLMPLQNNLANKHINVSLLYDCYEYDVQLYYTAFSSLFYNENYYFDKNNVYDLNLSENKTYQSRNKDYEFGCKRNIMNSGYQFMFYAPFYITDTKSLPDEFILHIEFDNNIYKNIRIKIFDNSDDDKISNYLSVYLKRYVEKIDERCIFCLPESNQATYFGIDVQYGGFKYCKDNVFGILYNKQLSVNEFDKIINEGFSRNKLIMRQIVPLSFMFNVKDILSKNEYNTYINKKVRISGWYEQNGMKYDFYDFDTNYKELVLNDVNILNPDKNTDVRNNRNLQYSLYESIDKDLKYDNTVSITHNRWCLLPTLDFDEKYITNSSAIFLDNNDNYYNVPVIYQSNSSYLYYNHNLQDIDRDKSFNALDINYIENIVSQTKFNESDIIKDLNWYDVFNNKCMIGGLLYDLNNLTYTDIIDDNNNKVNSYDYIGHIDKFNIFAYINIIDVNNKDIKYCKYSINTDSPFIFNSTAYNGYTTNMFSQNIVEYSYKYEKYHETNTIFEPETISYDYLMDCCYNGVQVDDVYVNFSDYYYQTNLYKKINGVNEISLLENNKVDIYKGFEVYDNIDAESFIDAVSYYDKFIRTNGVVLSDICYVTINQSNNARKISDKTTSDVVNSRNSRIAFYNNFVDCHKLINITYVLEKQANPENYRTQYDITMQDYNPYINSYYHYIPGYEDSAFISHGHLVRNDIHTDYVYCDYWVLEKYIDYINKAVTIENRIEFEEPIMTYMSFINYDHYERYRKRMYGDDVDIYVLELNPIFAVYGTGKTANITDFKINKKFRRLKDTDDVKTLISENKLYHYDKAVKITKDMQQKILNIYKNNYDIFKTKCVSLILYTTDETVVNNLKINKEGITTTTSINHSNNQIPILFPLTTEILWSRKSVDETYKILSSKNIKLDNNSQYIIHKIYDLENCNKINTNDENDIVGLKRVYDENNSVEFYKRITTPTIETDNKIKVIRKDGLNYAYYYITLNLFNNIYSINLNTSNNVDTFDLSNFTLSEILPYIKTNLLNYIINNLATEAVINKNDVNIIIDKTFDDTNEVVTNSAISSKLHINRYYNDITPLLVNTSDVISYNLIYNMPGNVKYKKKHYNDVVYAFYNVPIEYDDNAQCGIPYIDYNGEIKTINEYERKFYNNNEYYFLSDKFEINDKSLYTLDNIREIETDDYVFNNIFIPYINRFLGKNKLSDDEYLFLFNRYRIDYTSYPVKLNLLETDKMYKLKFTFTLL